MSLYGDLDPATYKRRSRRKKADPETVSEAVRLLDTLDGLQQSLSRKLREPVVITPLSPDGKPLGELETGREALRRRAAEAFRAKQSPPFSNTVVETQKDEPSALIDWLSVTFRGEDSVETAKYLFGAGRERDWVEQDRGGYAYAHALRRGQVVIYYGGSTNVGMCTVVVSGSGCRQLEAEGLIGGDQVLLAGVTPWQAFLYQLAEGGGTLARLDVALDDRSGLLSMEAIERAYRAGDCSTRFKQMRSEQGWNEGACTGQTLYFGTRSSNMFVRIYHKGLEQVAKGAAEEPENWIRCELESRNERAQKLMEQIITKGLRSVAGVLWAYLDFKTEESREEYREKDRYLRPTAEWWKTFIDSVEKMRLGSLPRIFSVEKTFEWMRRKIAPSLHMVCHATGLGFDALAALITEGGERLRKSHLTALIAHNSGVKSYGKPSFST